MEIWFVSSFLLVKVTKLKSILILKSDYTPVLVKSRQDDRRKRSFMKSIYKGVGGFKGNQPRWWD